MVEQGRRRVITTIAYRSGVLAGDTCIAYSSFTNGERTKIERCGDYFVALAGLSWLRRPLEEWVREGCPEDGVPSALLDNEDKFTCIVVDREGAAYQFNNGYLVPVCADYTAIGSGAMLALGAMAHGADAEAAVQAAARHDKNTGGPVTTHHFSALN